MPVGITRRNSFVTSSGRASVAMSQSSFSRRVPEMSERSSSRTDPPTAQERNPPSRSRAQRSRTSAGMAALSFVVSGTTWSVAGRPSLGVARSQPGAEGITLAKGYGKGLAMPESDDAHTITAGVGSLAASGDALVMLLRWVTPRTKQITILANLPALLGRDSEATTRLD